MKAVVVEELGNTDVLRLKDLPSPEPGPGQIVVDVAAAGVNFIDVYHRTGHYPPPAPLPFVPGGEGSGKVVAVAPTSTSWPSATGWRGARCPAGRTPSRSC